MIFSATVVLPEPEPPAMPTRMGRVISTASSKIQLYIAGMFGVGPREDTVTVRFGQEVVVRACRGMRRSLHRRQAWIADGGRWQSGMQVGVVRGLVFQLGIRVEAVVAGKDIPERGVQLEQHLFRQTVEDDAGNQRTIRVKLCFPLDDRSDPEQLVTCQATFRRLSHPVGRENVGEPAKHACDDLGSVTRVQNVVRVGEQMPLQKLALAISGRLQEVNSGCLLYT